MPNIEWIIMNKKVNDDENDETIFEFIETEDKTDENVEFKIISYGADYTVKGLLNYLFDFDLFLLFPCLPCLALLFIEYLLEVYDLAHRWRSLRGHLYKI